MSQPYAFFCNQFVPQAQAQLPLHDAGFVFGATVSDLCRTFAGQLFRWEDHLRRFRASCQLARIPLEFNDSALTAIALELIRRNRTCAPAPIELCLVLLATPGPIGYYLGQAGGAGAGDPTFIMHTFPLAADRYRALIERGADLVVPDVLHVPAACVDPRIKQRSRMHWWLADREVQAIRPGTQALLLNERHEVTETAAANFVIVKGGEVISPPAGAVLDGVSLQVLRELCGRSDIAFRERAIALEDCLGADEALLTSTPYCLAGVRRLNDRIYPYPGPMFERLSAVWNATVGIDIHECFR